MDKYNDIENIKWLFRNPKYNQSQSILSWKHKHSEEVKAYHKRYNSDHDIREKIKGFCNVCQKETSNLSQHNQTKKHKKFSRIL